MLLVLASGLHAQNTMQSPVDLGTKNASFTYSNTLNTVNYTNSYSGRSSNDVFYKFTLSVPMEITVSHCGSELSDTYVYLLDGSGSAIVSVDDYSGEGKCSSTYHPVIKRQLAAGTYYVVSEGYSSNGNITTSIAGTATSSGTVDIGTKSTSFTYTDTKNTTNTGNNYTGRAPNDVLYQFTLTVPMEITATHCGSELNDTYMTLLDASENVIVSVDDYSGEGKCSNTYHPVIKRQLAAGTYYIVSEGYNGIGNITTNITGTSNHVPVLYVSLDLYSVFLTDINQTAQLTATVVPSDATNKNVTWSSSNTSIATVSNTGLVTAKAVGQTFVTATTQEGGYSITATINVTTPSISSLVDLGTKGAFFTYTDTKNTTNTGNSYTGRAPNDVLYKFTMVVPMEITATHCGSGLNDTYMTLLDASKNVITSVDDYSGEGKCSNTYHSVIKRQLAAGTYFIVSEGYSSNGNITTNITGTVITYAYSIDGNGGFFANGTFSGNYPAGTTITLPTGAAKSGYSFSGFTCSGVWTGTKNLGGTFSMPAADITVTANWTLANVPVTGVSLNQTSLSLTTINQTVQLTETVSPSNATNKTVTWSSSNTSVATVSNTGLVTALAAGQATITVTTQDGNRTATCTITV
jgi:uncharacterized protein YjdB